MAAVLTKTAAISIFFLNFAFRNSKPKYNVEIFGRRYGLPVRLVRD